MAIESEIVGPSEGASERDSQGDSQGANESVSLGAGLSSKNGAPRFTLDENLPRAAELLLRGAGYDVATVIDDDMRGADDRSVLHACRDQGRVLVTLDPDVGDIRTYQRSDHRGIWVLHPEHHSVVDIVMLLRGAVALLATEACEERLWVIEKDRVIIRE